MDTSLTPVSEKTVHRPGELVLKKPTVRDRLFVELDRHPGRTLLVLACAGLVAGRLLRLAFRRDDDED